MSPNMREKSHVWDTKITRVGYYDPDNYYSKLLKQGVDEGQVIEMAKDEGDYLGTIIVDGNLAVNTGLQQIIDLFIGANSSPTWSAAYIGVGDSNTAEAASQTGLQASSNKTYAAMDSTYPKRSSQTAQFKSTFGAGTASYSWLETVVLTGNGSGTCLNRKVGAWGTKGANDSYSMEVDITLS